MLKALPQSLATAQLRRLSREFFWIGVGQALAVLGGIVGVRWLTGALSPSVYGELALGVTAATLVQQSIMGPIAQACLRFFAPARESGRFGAFLQAGWRLLKQGTVIVIAMAAGVVLLQLMSRGVSWLELTLAALLLSLVSGYGFTLDGIQTAARQRIIVAVHWAAAQWLRPALALGLIVELGATSTTAMLGYVIASLVVLASQTMLFWRRILQREAHQTEATRRDVDEMRRQLLVYAWPFATWGFLAWFQMASDRWALQLFRDTRSVGMYTVAYQLGYYPITLLSNAFLQLIIPLLFSQAGDGTDVSRVKEAVRVNEAVVVGSILVSGVFTVLAFIFHDQIFALLVAPEYRSISSSLPFLTLAAGLFTSGQAMSLILMTGADTRKLIACKITTALAGVVFNIAGAYFSGIEGVVVANVAFATFYFIWVFVLARRYRDVIYAPAPGGAW